MRKLHDVAAIEIRPAITKDADGIALTLLESAEYHAELDPERYSIPAFETTSTRYRGLGDGQFGIAPAIYGPGSNLADHRLLEITADGELILAGEPATANAWPNWWALPNPSGWSGVLKVKTPA